MILSVLIWSAHDLLGRKPACYSRKLPSTAAVIRSRSTRLKTYPGTDKRIIPRWFSHLRKSPFFGIFRRCPDLFPVLWKHFLGPDLLEEGMELACNLSVGCFQAICVDIISGPASFPFFVLWWLSWSLPLLGARRWWVGLCLLARCVGGCQAPVCSVNKTMPLQKRQHPFWIKNCLI